MKIPTRLFFVPENIVHTGVPVSSVESMYRVHRRYADKQQTNNKKIVAHVEYIGRNYRGFQRGPVW